MIPRRPLLAGNGNAGVLVLNLLLEHWAADDVLVVAPRDVGRPSWQRSLAAAARSEHVQVLAPEDVNQEDVVAYISARGTDLLLSVYYTQVFQPGLLDAVDGPKINFHPSLLPRHRGSAPLIWAIVEGDTVTGVSVHVLTQGIDTGPLVYQRPLPIHRHDTGFTLHEKAALHVRAAAAQLLRGLVAGDGLPPPVAQVGASCYHSTTGARVNHIQWTDPRTRIRDVVRALAPPLPGGFTNWSDRRLILALVEPIDRPTARPPGTVEVDPSTGAVFAWARDGSLEILRAVVDGTTLDGRALRDIGVRDGDQLT